MSFAPPRSTGRPKITTTDTNSWIGGVVTAYDDGRTPANGLRSASNVILDQDGTVRPRPSLQKFGPQPVGTILGEIFEFRTVSGLNTTNYMITLQNVSGTTEVYIAKPEDTTWTKCSGKTYDNTAKAHFFQINDKVMVLNGTDTLSYLDVSTVGSTNTVVPFVAIGNGTAPTIANNGSTSLITGTTSYTIYYAITANSTVGESTGVSTSLAINTQRDLWDKTVNSLKITWPAVTNAQSYNIYCAVTANGAGTPTLYQLATGIAATTLTYVDDGSLGLATFKEMPIDNSTAGPPCSRGTAINGRAWMTGDKNNPYYLWHGGDPGHEMDFTPAYGGGFTVVGGGTGEIPVRVWNFRSGPGTPEIKCLTRGLNGSGKRYTITSSTLTFGGQSFTVWAPAEDYGFSGTDSPDGLIVYGNNTYYPSRDGFRTIGTKPQLQNLLSNDEISQTIKTDLGLINNDAMDGCVGLGWLGRLYWAVPVQQSTNNEIWVLDLDRGGAWMKPWTVSADWMVLIADNNGYSHHVVLANNTIYEFSYNSKTSDDGVAFSTSGSTGLIYNSKDGRDWARLIRTVVEVLRLEGTITFSATGFTNEKKIVPLGSVTISSSTTADNYGWSEGGWGTFGWSDPTDVPSLVGNASDDAPININKNVRYWSLSWSTTGPNVDYNISKIVSEQVNVGIRNLN